MGLENKIGRDDWIVKKGDGRRGGGGGGGDAVG